MKNRPFEELSPAEKSKITRTAKDLEAALGTYRRKPGAEAKELIHRTREALATLLDSLMGSSALEFGKYDDVFREATEILNGVSAPSRGKPLNHWAPLPGDEVYADVPDGRESMIND